MIAVAVFPLCAGAWAGRALFERQRINAQAFPPALGDPVAKLALIPTRLEHTGDRRLDAVLVDRPAFGDGAQAARPEANWVARDKMQVQPHGSTADGAACRPHFLRDAADCTAGFPKLAQLLVTPCRPALLQPLGRKRRRFRKTQFFRHDFSPVQGNRPGQEQGCRTGPGSIPSLPADQADVASLKRFCDGAQPILG